MLINWKDHLINLISVILGISIAFWLNGWGEARKENKLEQQYLRGLIKDLEEDIQDIEGLMAYSDSQIEGLDSLLNFVIKGKTQMYDSMSYDLFAANFNMPFTPQDVTYQSLSGKIETIKDFDVRLQIIEYYNQYYTSMKIWDQSCKENNDSFLKPVMMKKIVFKSVNEFDTKIFEEVEMRNALFSARSLYSRRRIYMDYFLEAAQNLKRSLEDHLSSL